MRTSVPLEFRKHPFARAAAMVFAVAIAGCGGTGDPGANGGDGEGGLPGNPGNPGEAGPPGEAGTPGDAGLPGEAGKAGCDGLAVGETRGLTATITPVAPKNGKFYDTAEKIVFTISFDSKCGKIKVADLGTANLYLSGPRSPLLTKTASKLLNAVTDRTVTDRQHHNINLIAPKYGDTTGGNLVVNADDTLTYTTAAVSDEAAGTYVIGIWAKSKDEKNQIFPLKDIQIKNETAETYTTGVGDTASCNDCHKGTMSGGKSYMAHSLPGFSPLGNWALDSAAVANCKSCHNNDGYSENPIIRKAHAVHRGAHQMAPGAAHAEYGLVKDDSLAAFNNVLFPSSVDNEKDCTKCHKDDNWKTKPSRMACGTCHDNVFFDTGLITPPRVYGKPYVAASPYLVAATATSCAADGDCTSLGSGLKCNTTTGMCERRTHAVMTSDTACPTCHTADSTGFSPIPDRHEIYFRTKVRGLKVTDTSLSGGTGGTGGAFFQVGDTPIVKFKLATKAGTAVTDLLTNQALTGTILVTGPTDNPFRVYASTAIKCLAAPASCASTVGTLAYDSTTGFYTYTMKTPIPALSLPPLNGNAGKQDGPIQTNPAGTYTVWMYINETVCLDGTAPTTLTSGSVACKPGITSMKTTTANASVRDSASAVLNYKFLADKPIRPRKIITNEACFSCHTELSIGHANSRWNPETCHTCHSVAAEDKGIGWTFNTAAGASACTVDADCTGGVAVGGVPQWATCQGTTSKKCTAILDPTASTRVYFPAHIHNIHSARLRAGGQEAKNFLTPGTLNVSGTTFVDQLLPMDLRNCTKCHADTATTCAVDTDCGIGQSCVSLKCANTAWKNPDFIACVTCHDTTAAYAHGQLNTWTAPDGSKVEACGTCHGPGKDYASEKVHDPSGFNAPPSVDHSMSLGGGVMPWFRSKEAKATWTKMFQPSAASLELGIK
jgi:hypothetical protein